MYSSSLLMGGKTMAKFNQLLQLDLLAYWSSPANIACLFVVIFLGILLGPLNVVPDSQLASNCWSIAGKTFQYAGAFAGLIACIEAANLFQKDKQAMRFEFLITSGQSACCYAVSKITALVIPLFIAGIVLGALAQLCCYVNFQLVDLFAFFSGFLILYLPLVSTAVLFGYFFSLATNSQLFAFSFFFCIWLVGFLPLPPITGLFDLSGESLYVAFFDLPMDSLNYEDYKNEIPLAIWEEAMRSLQEQKYYGQWCLAVLLTIIVVLFVMTIFVLKCKWEKNSESLLPNKQTLSLTIHSNNSKACVFLKATKLWYLLFAIAVLSAGEIFLPFSDDSKTIALFFSEPLPAICVVIALCNIFSYPIKLRVNELQQIAPNSIRYLVFEILIVFLVIIFIGGMQAFQWQNILQSSFGEILISTVTSSLLFLILTYALLLLMKNRVALVFMLVALWLLSQLSSFKDMVLSLSLGWLYPFQMSLNGEASMALFVISLILYLVVSVIFVKKSYNPKP